MEMQNLLFSEEYSSDEEIQRVISNETIPHPYGYSYIPQYYHTNPIIYHLNSGTPVNFVPGFATRPVYQEPFSYFYYPLPRLNSQPAFAFPVYAPPFPQTNEPIFPPINQIHTTMVNHYGTMVNHPNMYGDVWEQMETIDQNHQLYVTHDSIQCPECGEVFTALRYASHLTSDCGAMKKSENFIKKEEVFFERPVDKKPVGQDFDRAVGKKPFKQDFEKAVGKKPIKQEFDNAAGKHPIGHDFEKAAGKKPMERDFDRVVGRKPSHKGVVIKEEPLVFSFSGSLSLLLLEE